MISQTVPSGSTRPNRCGSLETGSGDRRRRSARAGDGRGGPGRGAGLGVVGCAPGSLVVISVTSYPPRGHPRTCRATRRLIARTLFKQVAADRAHAFRDAFAYALSRHNGRPCDGQGGYRRPARPRRCVLHRDRRRHPSALGAGGHRRTGQPRRPVPAAAARPPVVAGQPRRGRRVRAAGRGAGLRFGAAGAGPAGDVAAVRAADQRPAVAPAGDPLGMDMGGAAGRRGRGDRDRRQSDRRALPGVVGDVDGGDRGARARAGAVRGGRADLVRAPSARCCWRWCPARCGACSRC